MHLKYAVEFDYMFPHMYNFDFWLTANWLHYEITKLVCLIVVKIQVFKQVVSLKCASSEVNILEVKIRKCDQ